MLGVLPAHGSGSGLSLSIVRARRCSSRCAIQHAFSCVRYLLIFIGLAFGPLSRGHNTMTTRAKVRGQSLYLWTSAPASVNLNS